MLRHHQVRHGPDLLPPHQNVCHRWSGVHTTNGLPTSFVGDVALLDGMAYMATEDKGVLRYDIANDTWLEPWGSTGINGVNNAPVAMVGDILHLGLQGQWGMGGWWEVSAHLAGPGPCIWLAAPAALPAALTAAPPGPCS